MSIRLKPKLTFILSFLVMAALILVGGCNKTDTPKTDTPAAPQNPKVILATTTSTQDSGLLDVLIPDFKQKTGYEIQTIAVGTGAALTMGEKGEADVLLVHAPSSEKKLVDAQTVTNYQLVMHNDFIIVGPSSDPANIKGTTKAADALKAIYDSGSKFVSRGDDSGTHKMELGLWTTANITPASGNTYLESGQGMGQTLTMASEMEAYTLTDRATYLATKDNLELDILLEGDSVLLNIYHVMQVNPDKFPADLASKINTDGAKAFVDYMVDATTQKVIGDFGKDKYGQPLFFPDAGKKMEDL